MSDALSIDGLLELPLEVLSIILGELSAKDLLRCAETCHGLYAIIGNVHTLQYTLALAAYGLVDNKCSRKSIPAKLESARLTYRAHRDFRWIPHFVIPLDGQRIEQPSSPLVLRNFTNATALSFLVSGSIVRDVPDHHWTIHPQPATAFSCAFNYFEDLLVLQKHDLPSPSFHLRTMSNGAVHPEAALPSLTGGVLGVEHLTYGPYLLISGANAVHTLWNWKTGLIVTTIRCQYSAVAFLNAEHVAITCMSDIGQSIHIYRLPFIIFNVDTDTMNPPQYAFGLPTLAPATAPLACSLNRGPSSSHLAAGSTAFAGDCYTDPDDVLLTVNYEQVAPRLQYAITIRLRSLLTLLTPEHLNQNTLWEEWGPPRAHACSLSRRRMTGWDSYSTFGMRHIDPYPAVRADGVLVATIRDYHRHRVALARRETPADDGRWVVVEGGTVGGEWIDMNELETLLPFVETTIPLPIELQSQGNRVIVLSINDDGIVASTVRLLALIHIP